MNINKIITETLHRYLNENIFDEKKQTKSQEVAQAAKRRDGENLSAGDENELRDIVNTDDLINVAALARKIYPGHTETGAQSQLRKKLEGEHNDNGSEYHLNQREASIIRKELNNIKR